MSIEPTAADLEVLHPEVAVGSVMLALGDSIAAGIGAAHVSEGCLALLASRLGATHPGLRFVNLAMPGESSRSMLAPGGQLERAEALIAAVGAEGGSVAPVLLSVGGNDAMEAQLVGDDEAMAALTDNLETILGRLDAALCAQGSALAGSACLQTVYNPFKLADDAEIPAGSGDADRMAPRRSKRGGHNRILRATAARFGIEVADVARAFRGRARELTWVASGDIHPRPAGHAAIAQLYVEACGWTLPD